MEEYGARSRQSETDFTQEEINKLKDKIQNLIKMDEYFEAAKSLRELVGREKDASQKFEALVSLAFCEFMGEKKSEQATIEQIEHHMREHKLSTKALQEKAEMYVKNRELVRGMTLYLCAGIAFFMYDYKNVSLLHFTNLIRDSYDMSFGEIKKRGNIRITNTENTVLPYLLSMYKHIETIEDHTIKSITLAHANHCVSVLRMDLEQFDKAETLLKTGIKSLEENLGREAEKYRIYSGLLQSLGSAKHHLGKLREAEEILKKSIDVRKRSEDITEEDRRKKIEEADFELSEIREKLEEIESSQTKSDSIIELKEKYEKAKAELNFTAAQEILQQLLDYQPQGWDRRKTLLRLAECEVVIHENLGEYFQQLYTAHNKLEDDEKMGVSLEKQAEDLLKTNYELAQSLILYLCAIKFYKIKKNSKGLLACYKQIQELQRPMKRTEHLKNIRIALLAEEVHPTTENQGNTSGSQRTATGEAKNMKTSHEKDKVYMEAATSRAVQQSVITINASNVSQVVVQVNPASANSSTTNSTNIMVESQGKSFPQFGMTDLAHIGDGVYFEAAKPLRAESRVFRGVMDGVTPELVAIKIIPMTNKDKREIENLKKLQTHPNVLAWKKSGEYMYQGVKSMYVATEMCDVDSLLVKLRTNDFSWSKKKSVLQQVTLGLNHIHKNGIAHRDLKPSNILFDKDGRVTIGDFGFSKKVVENEAEITSHSTNRRGTDGWSAPETYFGHGYLAQAADMFSLGLVYYYVLTNGQHPFGTESWSQIQNIIKNEQCSLAGINDDQAKNLIEKLLSHVPAERPTTEDILKDAFFT